MTRLLPGPTLANRGLVLLIVGLCTCIVAATAATGWWLRDSADEMAAEVFDRSSADARQLQVTYVEVADDRLPDDAAQALSRAMPPTLREAFGPPRHTVIAPDMAPTVLPPRPAAPAFLSVAGFPDLAELVEVDRGRLPRPGSAERRLPPAVAATYNPLKEGDFEPPKGPVRASVVEVVLERSAARELEISVGSWVQLPSSARGLGDNPSAVLHVVGTYEPAAPAPTALDDADSARKPSISSTPEFNLVRATALAADPRTVLGAGWETEPEVRWTFDLEGSASAVDADALVAEVRRAELQTWPPVLQASGFTAVTGVGDLAQQVVDQRTTSDGVLVLILTTLAAAALTVLLAAALVLAARRRDVTTVVRARGASHRWLVLLRGGEALLLVAPGVLVALGALAATGGVGAADMLVVATSAATCVVLITAAQAVPRAAGGERLRTVLRDALQLVTVGLAGAATVLVLLDDDLRPDDPALLLVPPLLGAATAVLLMRVLQGGLDLLRRAAGGTRRAVPVVSLSQASALARQVVLASAAVVLAGSSTWLAVSVGDSLRTGAERSGWEQVGADVAVRTNGVHDDTVARLAAVPGTDRVAAIATTDSVSLDTRTGVEGVQLLATDTDALAAVGEQRLRDLELPDAPPGELTAVASPDLELSDEQATLRHAQSSIPIRVVDRVDEVPGVTHGGSFVLVDIEPLTEIVGRRQDAYSTILLQGTPDRDRVREVAESVDPLAEVHTRQAVAETLLEAPVASRTLTMLGVVRVATAVLALFAVLLLVGLGAPTRRRTGTVLTAVGADARQVRRANALALLPIVAAACAAAAACGVLLTTLVAHGFDLAGLTGTVSDLAVRPTPGSAALLGGGLAGLVVLAVAAARTRAGRPADLDDLDQEHR